MIKNISNVKIATTICGLLLCLVSAFLFCFLSLQGIVENPASAVGADYVLVPMSNEATTQAVNDTATVIFTATPAEYNQGCTWALSWDYDKTSAGASAQFDKRNVSDYIGLTVNGSTCTVKALQYFKIALTKWKVFINLTATSVENQALTAVCSIQLG